MQEGRADDVFSVNKYSTASAGDAATALAAGRACTVRADTMEQRAQQCTVAAEMREELARLFQAMGQQVGRRGGGGAGVGVSSGTHHKPSREKGVQLLRLGTFSLCFNVC